MYDGSGKLTYRIKVFKVIQGGIKYAENYRLWFFIGKLVKSGILDGITREAVEVGMKNAGKSPDSISVDISI